MIDPTDIRKKEVKVVDGDKWRFSHRENGYIILEKYAIENNKVKWNMQLHATSMESALQYIFQDYKGKCGILSYEELEDENTGSKLTA